LNLGVGQFGGGSHNFSISPGYPGWLTRAQPAAGLRVSFLTGAALRSWA